MPKKLAIITIPDPVLREVSAPVERVDGELQQLIDDMLETMYQGNGVGLAAIQVGVRRRLLVCDCSEEGQPLAPQAFINPEIVSLGATTRVYEEGCLSIPDVRFDIERPSTLTVRYTDRQGQRQEVAADGLLATVLQHEIDHLEGKLIIDFLSKLKRDRIIKRVQKNSRAVRVL
jgi:peptide deformylase